MKITVVRLGHRTERDKRVTTHCALVARALGAESITLCGEKDDKILESVKAVVNHWGGNFYITYSPSWKKTLSTLKRQHYTIVHATMYGEPLQKKAKKISSLKKIAIVVGAEKVPSEVYAMTDYNIAVTSQPHSEIAALALILHAIQGNASLEKKFSRAKISITPQARGKKVTKRN